ncbi:uncharacterized protein LOC103958800 [Pyrus x bretschneideri]|uniref:uncharacterized protein LOC103958800 n=1 Tax=Pyrus x bretschneideri TaxID=225117 RepID=UPI002030DC6D|nr:uncharacterized protein LOC103958800 [Pyrus x bretschneideri]
MGESEKLTALKKAYAEIILDTAKEAASRIVVSERKALRFQRELFSAKDEAFRMLLRLKQMLDSKDDEAKTMSLSQQEKIDELEAQLQEAEDIVKELREELSEVQARLEKARSNPRQSDEQNLEGNTAARGSITSQLNSVSNGTYNSLKDNYCACNPDFVSLVMRGKQPELYRNGCTQRIAHLKETCWMKNSLFPDLLMMGRMEHSSEEMMNICIKPLNRMVIIQMG